MFIYKAVFSWIRLFNMQSAATGNLIAALSFSFKQDPGNDPIINSDIF